VLSLITTKNKVPEATANAISATVPAAIKGAAIKGAAANIVPGNNNIAINENFSIETSFFILFLIVF
jgi:hypothetical protein